MLAIYFNLPNISEILFQYVSNIKIIEIFYFFVHNVQNLMCILHSQFGVITFQVSNNHMWLVVTTMDNVGLGLYTFFFFFLER